MKDKEVTFSSICEFFRQNKKGLLFIISGPSGVGKGTIRKEILQIFPELKYSVSANTRSPRKDEQEGIDYYFVTKEKFESMIRENKFAEWAIVHGEYKGTPIDFLIEQRKKGSDIILEIDVQGARQIKEKFPEGIFIFIAPPSWKDLVERLQKRGTETKKDLEKRLDDAFNEIKQIGNYDYIVINDELEMAVKEVESIIIAERCKVANYEIRNFRDRH